MRIVTYEEAKRIMDQTIKDRDLDISLDEEEKMIIYVLAYHLTKWVLAKTARDLRKENP